MLNDATPASALKADDTSAISTWLPPTPGSILQPLPAPPPPLQLFEPLPPPLTQEFTVSRSQTFSTSADVRGDAGVARGVGTSMAGLLNHAGGHYEPLLVGERATPGSFRRASDAEPIKGFFHDSAESRPTIIEPSTLAPPPRHATVVDTDHLHMLPGKISPRKRPRRDGTSNKSLAERPGSDYEGEASSKSPAGPTGSQSNRKVSHSLIERRRREKINDCLGTLKTMVPHCREEGERKEARAKERGRKRGKKDEGGMGDDEGNRGGLHKLEILQGTILYIEELEAKIVALETAASPRVSAHANMSPPSTHSRSFSPISPDLADVQPLRTPVEEFARPDNPRSLSSQVASTLSTVRRTKHVNSYHSTAQLQQPQNPSPPISASNSSSSGSSNRLAPIRTGLSADAVQAHLRNGPFVPDEDTEAGLLLLRFSTSPQLRPVMFD